MLVGLCVLTGCQAFDTAYGDCVARNACTDGGSSADGGSRTDGGSTTDGGTTADGGTADGGGADGGSLLVEPSAFTFTTLLGATSRQDLQVTNKTSRQLTPTVQLTGADRTQFSLSPTSCPSLATDEFCVLSLAFQPTGAGLAMRNANVLVQGAGSFTLPIIGNVEAPFTLDSPQLDFGSINVSNTASRTLTITNHTAAMITPTYTIQPTAFTKDGRCVTVPLSSNCSFDVIFSPVTAGAFAGPLTVSSAGYAAPDISLQGTGVALGQLRLTQNPFSGVVADAGTSVFKPFTISNSGTTTIGPISLALTGDPQFALTDAGCSTLAPGATCDGQLRFLATANASYSATLVADGGLAGIATSSLSASGYADGVLEFLVGGTRPANPDVILPTNLDVTRTYTVHNASSGATSAISFSLSNAGGVAWRIEAPDGGASQCPPGATLNANATCTVSVTFHAGLSGQPAGTFDAGLVASAVNGGSATQGLGGAAAYTWQDAGVFAAPSYDGTTPPTGACPSRNAGFWQLLTAVSGAQYAYWHESAFDLRCMAPNNWFFQVPARNNTQRYPGLLRACGGGMTWVSGDHAPAAVGDSLSFFCGPPSEEPLWANGDTGPMNSCSSNLTAVVRNYDCH